MGHRPSPPLFDGPELLGTLRRDVVPMLRTWPFVRVWQFGLSVAGDVWTTAILLREEGLAARSLVYATDPSSERIAACRAGRFTREIVAASVAGYAQSGGRATLDEYLSFEADSAKIRELLAARICFFQHDPCHDASFNEFQLVLWRPDPASAAEHVPALVRASLCRFGIVAVLGAAVPASLRASHYRDIGPGLLRRES